MAGEAATVRPIARGRDDNMEPVPHTSTMAWAAATAAMID